MLQSSTEPGFHNPQCVTNYEAGTNVLRLLDSQALHGLVRYYRVVPNTPGGVTNQPPVTNQAPIIVTQPGDATVVAGEAVIFQVTAAGTTPLYYRWYGPGSALIPGATTSTLTLSNVQPSAAGAYFAFVTNQFGFAHSSNAVLTVTGGTNQPPGTNQAPVITQQPTNQTVAAGGTASFSATATGSAPLHYEWYGPDGTLIPGATISTLTLSNVQPSAAGAYFVFVTNQFGFAQSLNAVLTVTGGTNQPPVTNQAPVIVTQPGNSTVLIGDAAIFQVTAIGTAPLSYQWFKGGTNLINGATNNYYSILPVGTNDAGIYRVLVTNPFGFVFSTNATLTVITSTNQPPVTNQAPVITQQPTNQTVSAGGTASFSATATGSAPLHYDWYGPDDALIPGATSSTLTLSNVQPSAAGAYFVFVTNQFGFAHSSNAVLTVTGGTNQPPVTNQAPVITQQPTNQTVAAGGTASFSATATGTAPLYYRWYGPGSALIPGAKSSTLTLTNVQASAAGVYFAFVTNQFGFAQSSNAVLTVTGGTNQPPVTNQAPVIVTQPWDATVLTNDAAIFQVTATGTAPLLYQWFKGTNVINGATNNYYSILPVNLDDAGVYRVLVSNPFGFVFSTNATLTVITSTNQPPVTNQAPVITQQPTNQTVAAGGMASFSAAATGTALLHYEWYGPDSALIPGATSSTLTLSNVQSGAAGAYFVFVTNQFGFAQSSNAVLTVTGGTNQPPVTNQAPVIVTQPGNSAVLIGDAAIFQVTATGTQPLLYQWFKGGTNLINGATNNYYSILPVGTNDAGIYRVLVSNPFGFVFSTNAMLSVITSTNQPPPSTNQPPVTNQTPVIVSQLGNSTVLIGDAAIFQVTATGTAPLSYQWFKDGTNFINGATNNYYSILPVGINDAGTYRVLVTNPVGFVYSTNTTLTVITSTNQPLFTNQLFEVTGH